NSRNPPVCGSAKSRRSPAPPLLTWTGVWVAISLQNASNPCATEMARPPVASFSAMTNAHAVTEGLPRILARLHGPDKPPPGFSMSEVERAAPAGHEHQAPTEDGERRSGRERNPTLSIARLDAPRSRVPSAKRRAAVRLLPV